MKSQSPKKTISKSRQIVLQNTAVNEKRGSTLSDFQFFEAYNDSAEQSVLQSRNSTIGHFHSDRGAINSARK